MWGSESCLPGPCTSLTAMTPQSAHCATAEAAGSSMPTAALAASRLSRTTLRVSGISRYLTCGTGPKDLNATSNFTASCHSLQRDPSGWLTTAILQAHSPPPPPTWSSVKPARLWGLAAAMAATILRMAVKNWQQQQVRWVVRRWLPQSTFLCGAHNRAACAALLRHLSAPTCR